MQRSNFEEKISRTLSKDAIYISQGNTYGQGWSIPKDLNYNNETEEIFYSSERKTAEEHKRFATLKIITDKDSQNTAWDHTQEIKEAKKGPLVMNAANARHIGGAWKRNTGTQEESLFFTTNLHKHLDHKGHVRRHPWNPLWEVQHYNKPLQHTLAPNKGPNALYTKDVRCFKKAPSPDATKKHLYEECAPFSFAVFTIAGFDLRHFGDEGNDRHLFESARGFDWGLFAKAMQMKYELFFQTAVDKGHESVVAAALGCGAFAHPQFRDATYRAVATGYQNALKKYAKYFKRIDIVVLDPTAAEIFKKQVKRVTTPDEADPAYYSLRTPPFFANEITAVEKTHQRLLDLSDQYLQASCLDAGAQQDDLASKKEHFLYIEAVLKNPTELSAMPETLSTEEKHMALQKVKAFLISDLSLKKETLAAHRSNRWLRYLYNILSIITLLPALTRSASSRYYYGSFQFWKTKSLKVRETIEELLVGIPANKPT